MMKECLNCIFVKQYHGQTIYIHNFSTFDAIFLLRVLSSFKDCTITPHPCGPQGREMIKS